LLSIKFFRSKFFQMKCYRARNVELPGVNVVDEGDVVGRMPVQAVADCIERNILKKFVNRGNNLKQS
jgi:hypothetical protein